MSTRKMDQRPRGPQPVADVVAEWIARLGIGRPQATGARDSAWRQAVGQQLAQQTRCGHVRRGTLEVIVANSTLMQEMTFQKGEIVARLAQVAPELAVRALRFRVGQVP